MLQNFLHLSFLFDFLSTKILENNLIMLIKYSIIILIWGYCVDR